MHPLRARFVPRRDILLCVLPREPFLVIWLAPIHRACCGSVSLLYIEPAREANIPIGMLLSGVREFGASGRQRRCKHAGGGRCSWEQGKSGHRRESLGRRLLTSMHVVREGGALTIVASATSSSPTTSATTATATAAMLEPSTPCTWNLHRLDGGYMVCVALSGRRGKRHGRHLLHDGGLICRQLLYRGRDVGRDSGSNRWRVCLPQRANPS